MGVLVMVRHGAEEHRPERLTPVGVEQAERTAARLAELVARPAVVVHSPMPRAAETARILADRLGLALAVDDLLAECIPELPPPGLLTTSQQEAFASFSTDELASGARQAAAARARYLSGPPALVVLHGNLIRWLVASALGASPAWFQLADYHGGISALSLRPGRPPALLAYNDVGHLPPELRGDEYPDELRW
jgi:serine/threonine-protein phosphatase PGAM5